MCFCFRSEKTAAEHNSCWCVCFTKADRCIHRHWEEQPKASLVSLLSHLLNTHKEAVLIISLSTYGNFQATISPLPPPL